MNGTRDRFDPESGLTTEQALKNDNDQAWLGIGQNLLRIKQKSLEIKNRLELSNKTTEDIGSVYERSLKIVSDTMSNLKKVLSSNSGVFCYLFIFILLLFIFLYWKTS